MSFLSKYMEHKGLKKKPEEELKEGVEEETKEHSIEEEDAEKIAKDHIEEDDKHYEKMKFMKEHPKALEHFMMAVKCAKGE